MGSKTRLSSYCTKRANNGVNLATSRKIITRLARPIDFGPSAKIKMAAIEFFNLYAIDTPCELDIFRTI